MEKEKEKETDIHEEGYLFLPNLFSPNELQYGLSSVHENQIHYPTMKKFIDHVMFPKIIDKSHVIKDTLYIKFRYSNHSNALDASTFHGDVYNHTNSKLMPLYTCLCYFDDAQLEVIPGSHKYNKGSSTASYRKKKVLTMKQGDMLIFHANLHHRGIGYYKTENRRVLQVFEVFPDKKTYDENISKTVIVKSSGSSTMSKFIAPFMYKVSQSPLLIEPITRVHYWFMFNDLHYKVLLIDVPPHEKKNKYVGYESGPRLMYDDVHDKEDLNINIICDKQVTSVSFSNYYLYMFLMFIVVIIILVYVIRNHMRTRPSKFKKRN